MTMTSDVEITESITKTPMFEKSPAAVIVRLRPTKEGAIPERPVMVARLPSTRVTEADEPLRGIVQRDYPSVMVNDRATMSFVNSVRIVKLISWFITPAAGAVKRAAEPTACETPV